jgi:mutator protein MutT
VAGRLLVCERPAHKRHGGFWEFPGGKVEPGESDLDAVRRELREELDVDVVYIAPAEFSTLDPGSPFLIVFLPVEIGGEPRCLEHAARAWVADEELSELARAVDGVEVEEHVFFADHRFTTKQLVAHFRPKND